MTRDEIAYALSKQVSTIISIHTNYGEIELDSELETAVAQALRTVLTARLKRMDEAAVPSPPCKTCGGSKVIYGHGGWDAECPDCPPSDSKPEENANGDR